MTNYRHSKKLCRYTTKKYHQDAAFAVTVWWTTGKTNDYKWEYSIGPLTFAEMDNSKLRAETFFGLQNRFNAIFR